MYNRLPEGKRSGSKHVGDIKNKNINLENVHFVGLYYIMKFDIGIILNIIVD